MLGWCFGLSGAEAFANSGEMPLDGFVAVRAIFGSIGIGEARPAGIVACFDGCKSGGLDREARCCMKVMDKCADTGKIMSIESRRSGQC